MRPLNVLTWHVHGNYLSYLAHARHHFYLPVKPGRPEGYGGRCGNTHWPANLHEVPAEEVKNLPLDCILFQSQKNCLQDQFELLSPSQQNLPKIYLEHDPPRQTPTDTRHPVDDANVLIVHVTPFNDLMWDCGRTPTRVIDHGVVVPPDVHYRGDLPRGIVVVNGLGSRGRRLGADIFERVRRDVPLDLVGMHSEAMGGGGEVAHAQLPAYISHYRFFFHPVRYASLGLAVCEAMMVGMPVLGLATTEMAMAITNGVSGHVDTNVDNLVRRMRELIDQPREARRLGEGARRYALRRFGIPRFARDWEEVLALVTDTSAARAAGERPFPPIPETAGEFA